MSIKSHLFAGALGGVFGLLGGTALGLAIGEMRTKAAEKDLMKSLDGLPPDKGESIIETYQPIIDTLVDDLNVAKEGLGDELKDILQLCLPERIETSGGREIFKIPKLRDFGGEMQIQTDEFKSITRLFDEYYREKGEKTDYYSTVIKVLDNIHYVLFESIDYLAGEYSKENEKALIGIEEALHNLNTNVSTSELGKERKHKVLNLLPEQLVNELKREVVTKKLNTTIPKVVKKKVADQKKVTLIESCDNSLNNLNEGLRAMGEFFLRAFNDEACQENFKFLTFDMAENRLRWNVKKSNEDYIFQGPMSEQVVNHMHIAEEIQAAKEVDKVHYFNNFFNKGVFRGHNHQLPKNLEDLQLPRFMRKYLKEHGIDLSDDEKIQIMCQMNGILNNLNIAIALEEDMKFKVDQLGISGIAATGEFQLRRQIIDGFHQRAMDDFKQLFQEGYFKDMVDAHEMIASFEEKQTIFQQIGGSAQEYNISFGNHTKNKRVINEHLATVMTAGSSYQTVITDSIETVQKSQSRVKKGFENIDKQVETGRAYGDILPIELNSSNFFMNIAWLIEDNPGMHDSLMTSFEEQKQALKNKMSLEITNELRNYPDDLSETEQERLIALLKDPLYEGCVPAARDLAEFNNKLALYTSSIEQVEAFNDALKEATDTPLLVVKDNGLVIGKFQYMLDSKESGKAIQRMIQQGVENGFFQVSTDGKSNKIYLNQEVFDRLDPIEMSEMYIRMEDLRKKMIKHAESLSKKENAELLQQSNKIFKFTVNLAAVLERYDIPAAELSNDMGRLQIESLKEKKHNKELLRENRLLLRTLESTTNTNQALEESNELLQDTVSTLGEKNRTLLEETESLRISNEKLSQEAQSQFEIIEQQSSDISELKDELKVVENAQHELKANYQELESQIQRVDARYSEFRDITIGFIEEISTNLREVGKITQVLAGLIKEIESPTQDLDETQLNEKYANLQQLKNKLEKLLMQVNSMQELCGSKLTELAAIDDDITPVFKRIESSLAVGKEQIELSQLTLSSAVKLIESRLEVQIRTMQASNSKMSDLIEEQKVRIESQDIKLHEQDSLITTMSDTIEDQKSVIEQQKLKISELEDLHEKHQSKIERLQSSIYGSFNKEDSKLRTLENNLKTKGMWLRPRKQEFLANFIREICETPPPTCKSQDAANEYIKRFTDVIKKDKFICQGINPSLPKLLENILRARMSYRGEPSEFIEHLKKGDLSFVGKTLKYHKQSLQLVEDSDGGLIVKIGSQLYRPSETSLSASQVIKANEEATMVENNDMANFLSMK